MKKGLIIGLVIVCLILVLIGSAFFGLKTMLNAPNSNITDYKIVEITERQSTEAISAMLFDKKIIQNQWIFLIGTKLNSRPIHFGYYQISPDISTAEVINILTLGQTKVEKVTIPEGYRIEQIAKILDKKNIVKYEDFVKSARGQEGKLFPDTYFFTYNMMSDKVVAAMRNDYANRTKDLTVDDETLIIASIVEREAISDTDRAMIAGIYKNRLKIGMKLQSDPTVEYARDTNNLSKLSIEEQREYSYWRSAKTTEFTSVISKFNTYQVAGLPAGSICNPGIASIKATISPTKSDYYYFLYGKDGKFYPAKSLIEHQANVQRYL
ncbi:MAG: endolytic transglycosylase MltG [bacterium]